MLAIQSILFITSAAVQVSWHDVSREARCSMKYLGKSDGKI